MTVFISVYQHGSEVNEAMLKAWKDIFGINIQIDMTKREDDGDWEAKKPSILKEDAKY
tara:strand:- start:3469 stop:3642 length:174 start_codon:yes stop_codon:yes gene_type:complete